ncbi:DUF4430 domain-containing protein [Neobacillus sp. Marseille-QA0830]
MKNRPKKLIFAIVAFLLIVGIAGFSSIAKSKDEAKSENVQTAEEKSVSTTATEKKAEEKAATTEPAAENTAEDQAATTTAATEQTNATQTGQIAASAATPTENKQPAASASSSTSAASVAQPSQTTTNAAASQPATTPTAPAVTTTSPAPEQTVKITIIGPKDRGTILGAESVTIKEGNTILDVLFNAIGKSNVDYSGSGATAYVAGINNIYEFDYGPKSGWTCYQNGTKLSRGVGITQVKANDQIEWKYTEDYSVNQ